MQKIKNNIKYLFIFLIVLVSSIGLIISVRSSMQNTGKLTFINEKPLENEFLKDYVYISGGIKNPGVYEITGSTRIIDLIAMSGGFSENVDNQKVAEDINLAELLQDGAKVFIPVESSEKNTYQENINTSLINLNTATIEELNSLPGIGESTAKKIIDSRPFNSVDDLNKVNGIGESKFAEIKDLVTVE